VMHEPEKSDSAVVAVKSTNNAEQSAAESVPIGLQRDAICGVPSRGGLDLTDLVNDPAALDGAARCDTHSLSLNSADRCFRKCF
jgi:hypothetical protein